MHLVQKATFHGRRLASSQLFALLMLFSQVYGVLLWLGCIASNSKSKEYVFPSSKVAQAWIEASICPNRFCEQYFIRVRA